MEDCVVGFFEKGAISRRVRWRQRFHGLLALALLWMKRGESQAAAVG